MPLSAEHWQRVKDAFHAVLTSGPSQRQSALDSACGTDAGLREEVESLIAALDADPSFIAGDAFGLVAPTLCRDPFANRQVGAYRLVRPIGYGGMGSVYLAGRSDDAYRKQVAVKFLRTDPVLTDPTRFEHSLRRFRIERQTLAQLDHPHIARLLDGGATEEGIPYLVMEFIDGLAIDEDCDRRRLTISERVQLFQTVCEAVHYAHQHLVIHRDLKPSNILVTAEGAPKLLDFGVAKLLSSEGQENDGVTVTGFQPMTLEYASPEQLRGETVTTASDVYSLGLILYELLTGHRPFRVSGVSHHELVRILSESAPTMPSVVVIGNEEAPALGLQCTDLITPESVSLTREGNPDRLRRRLEGDLDMIVLKALRKEPERRYISAEQFAEDLRRHLEGRPVIAQPDTLAYRGGKFIRRNRTAVAALVAVFVVLTSSAALSTWLYWDADAQRSRATEAEAIQRQERQDAEAARNEAEAVTRFLTQMLSAVAPFNKGKDVTVRAILDEASDKIASVVAGKPTVEARLRATIGNAYAQLGALEPAAMHLSKAADLSHRFLGDDDPLTLGTSSDMATVARKQGRPVEAERLHHRIVAVQRRVLGPNHRDTLKSANLLAGDLRAQGRLAAAEEVHRATWSARVGAFGQDDRDTLASMNNLGIVLREQGRYAEAEALHRSALEGFRRILGSEHQYTLAAMSTLGFTLCADARFSEGEPILRTALDVQRHRLGDEHTDTNGTLHDLARAVAAQSRNEEAELHYRTAAQTATSTLGEEDHRTLQIMRDFAFFLSTRGKREESERICRKLAVVHKTLAERPDATALDLSSYAELLLGCGSPSEPDVRSVLDNASRAVELTGRTDPHMLATLALAQSLSGQADAAVDTQRAALAGLPTSQSPLRILLEGQLGEYLVDVGDFANAEPLLLNAFDRMAEEPHAPLHQKSEARQRLIQLYDRCGRVDDAAKYRKLVLDSPTE